MTRHHLANLKTPIGEVLEAAGDEGVLIEPKNKPAYAIMRLDDELLDYLLERSPSLIKQSAQIRDRMHRGEFHSHEDVKRLLREE